MQISSRVAEARIRDAPVYVSTKVITAGRSYVILTFIQFSYSN